MGVVRSRVLVGRDREMSLLREAWQRADARRPTVVLVEGEAGIGKTRLVRELAEEIDGADEACLIATGHGVDLAVGVIPYGLAASLLQDLAMEVGEDAVDHLLGSRASSVSPLLHGSVSADGDVLDRLALFGAVQHLLARLSSDRLVCLFVEDLHWADVSSLDLLVFLARTARPGRLLLVATVRPVAGLDAATARQVADLTRAAEATALVLRPLAADAVSEQVRDALGGAVVHRDLVRQVEALSDGVPLYVEELLAAAVGNGSTSTATLPATLAVTLTARVEGMSPNGLLTLQAAAVEERPFEVAELADVTQQTRAQLVEALSEASSVGVLDELTPGRYRFHHALLRRALADSVPAPERARWHSRWAETLERAVTDVDHAPDLGLVAAVAQHWYLAAEPDRALASAVRVARAAAALDAPRETAVHLRRALDLWTQAASPTESSGLDRNTLVVLLAEALDDGNESQAILDLVDQEERRNPTPTQVERLWYGGERATARFLLGVPSRFPVGKDELPAVIDELARETPSRMLLRTLERVQNEARLQGLDQSEVNAHIQRVVSEIGHEGGLALVLVTRADLAIDREDYETAITLASEAMAWADRHRPREYLTSARTMLLSAWALGRYERAVEIADEMLGRIGSPLAEPGMWQQVVTVATESCRMLGRYDRVIDLSTGALDSTSGLAKGAALSQMALVRAVQGEFAAAQDLAASAAAVIPAIGTVGSDVNWTGIPVWASAQLALEQARHEHARDLLRPVLAAEELSRTSRFNWNFVLAAAQALVGPVGPGDVGSVRAAADSLVRVGVVGHAWSTEVRAHVGRAEGRDATDQFRQAAEIWHSLSAPVHEAACRLWAADAVLDGSAGTATDRSAAAAGDLVRALELAERVGALPLAQRVRDLAARARISLPGQRRATPPAAHLTEREADVLRLVVRGQTNEQIGAALFMSPKTASVHVSRIIAKLGASNRTEVAGLAHRLGLGEG